MKSKIICPHCKKKVYELITISERIKKEGIYNGCEYCKFEENDIRNKVDLNELYIKFNEKYFNNKLPVASKIKINWNTRLRSTAGTCSRNKKLIEISTYYHNLHPEELNRTLVHEMIHLKESGHKSGFKREAERITKMGLEITIYTKYSEDRESRNEYRWEYQCQSKDCSVYYKRIRRLDCTRYTCECGGKLKEIQLLE